MPGYSLELETIKRLGKMLKAYEGGGMAPTLRQHITEDYGPPVEPGLHVVEVTGPISGSYYPANFMDWTGSSWTSLYAVRVIESNGTKLKTGKYFARVVGVVSVSGVDFELYAVTLGPALTQSVVTDVSCSGSTLVVTKKTLGIPGGFIFSE